MNDQQLDDLLSVQITHAAHLLERRVSKRVKALGLSMAGSRVLAVLADKDGQMVGELAARCYLQQPSVTRALEQLERIALVRRMRDRNDARFVYVYLTEEGRRRSTELRDTVAVIEKNDLSKVSEKHRSQLSALLAEVIAVLEDGHLNSGL